jgi:predicted nucleic acid-binding protein
VIAADTNLLVYSHRIDSPWHEAARECIRSLAEGWEPWAIAWPCLHEFYAVVTHPQIYRPPSTHLEAVAQIEAWMTSPRLVLLVENDSYWNELRRLLDRGRVVGPISTMPALPHSVCCTEFGSCGRRTGTSEGSLAFT